MPPSGGGGTPPPGGGWGPPSGGGPPSYGGGPPSYGGGPPSQGGFPPQAPPQKSKTGLYIGVGCGCMLLLACVVGGGIYAAIDAAGPGEEVTSVDATIGQPFTLTYNQSGSQKYAAWLEVDLDHSSSYNLTSTIIMSADGVPFGQYTMAEDGNGSPVTERSDSIRLSWVHTGSSTSGTTRLFPIPAQSSGQTISITGTVQAPPGTTGQIRIFVAERD